MNNNRCRISVTTFDGKTFNLDCYLDWAFSKILEQLKTRINQEEFQFIQGSNLYLIKTSKDGDLTMDDTSILNTTLRELGYSRNEEVVIAEKIP